MACLYFECAGEYRWAKILECRVDGLKRSGAEGLNKYVGVCECFRQYMYAISYEEILRISYLILLQLAEGAVESINIYVFGWVESAFTRAGEGSATPNVLFDFSCYCNLSYIFERYSMKKFMIFHELS